MQYWSAFIGFIKYTAFHLDAVFCVKYYRNSVYLSSKACFHTRPEIRWSYSTTRIRNLKYRYLVPLPWYIECASYTLSFVCCEHYVVSLDTWFNSMQFRSYMAIIMCWRVYFNIFRMNACVYQSTLSMCYSNTESKVEYWSISTYSSTRKPIW